MVSAVVAAAWVAEHKEEQVTRVEGADYLCRSGRSPGRFAAGRCMAAEVGCKEVEEVAVGLAAVQVAAGGAEVKARSACIERMSDRRSACSCMRH